MNTLWPDNRMGERIKSVTRSWVALGDAWVMLTELRDEYEAERVTVAAMQEEAAFLQAEIDTLRLDMARLQADAYVEIGNTPDAVSRFRTGMQDIDSSLRLGNVPNGGMLQDYGESDPQPWYYSYKLLHDHFSEGASLYPVTVTGGGIYAEATDGLLMLVNMTGDARKVAVGATVVELEPYQTKAIEI